MSGEWTPAIKKKLHYRKAPAPYVRKCAICGHYRVIPIYKIGGELHKYDSRCEVIGLHNSIKYKVRGDHICDRFALFSKQAETAG